jgi:hypothetical protein
MGSEMCSQACKLLVHHNSWCWGAQLLIASLIIWELYTPASPASCICTPYTPLHIHQLYTPSCCPPPASCASHQPHTATCCRLFLLTARPSSGELLGWLSAGWLFPIGKLMLSPLARLATCTAGPPHSHQHTDRVSGMGQGSTTLQCALKFCCPMGHLH